MDGSAPLALSFPLLQADLTGVVLHPATFAALSIATCFIIVYYLLSKLLNSPQIEAFAREELSQFVFTLVILASWLVFYGICVTIISAEACGGATCDQFSLAYYALDALKYRLISAYTGFWSIEVFVGFLSTVGFSLPLGTPLMAVKWLSFAPLGGLSALSNVVVGVIEMIGMLIGLVIGREQLLSFFQAIVPAFLLPAGLLMRCLPFTRVTGSSIIALCFAGFFIFPFSIALSHSLIFEQYTPTYIPTLPTPTGFCEDPDSPDDYEAAFNYMNTTTSSFSEYLSGLPDPSYASVGWYDFSSLITTMFGALGTLVDGVISFFKENWSPIPVIVGLFKPTTFGYLFYYITLDRLQGFSQLAVMTSVTFVLEIIITVTGYRAISSVLGGEMEILGLTKVV